MWPDSAQEVAEEPGVRVVPLLRYPYNVFYRNTGEAIEILSIHHAASLRKQVVRTRDENSAVEAVASELLFGIGRLYGEQIDICISCSRV
jgi:hypothetical protein